MLKATGDEVNEAHFEKMAAKALEDVFQQLGWLTNQWFVSSSVFPPHQKNCGNSCGGTLKCPHFVQDGYHDLFWFHPLASQDGCHDLFCVLGGESKSAIVFLVES